MKMVELAFRCGIASYACVLDGKNLLLDELPGEVLNWKEGDAITLGILIVMLHCVKSKIMFTDMLLFVSKLHTHRPTEEEKELLKEVYCMSMADRTEGKKSCNVDGKRMKGLIATAHYLILLHYGEKNKERFTVLPSES